MKSFIQPSKNIEQTNIKINSTPLEFSREISPIIGDICHPLINLGITIFTYCRIFNNGKRLYVCNDQKWVEHYIGHNYQDELDHLEHYVPNDGVKYALWSEFKIN